MGDVAIGPPVAAGRLAWARTHKGLIAAVSFWVLFVANFNPFSVPGDGTRPLSFTELIFGDVSHAGGYQFGLSLVELPFYGLGKLLEAAGVSTIGGLPVAPGFVALEFGLLVLVVAWLTFGLLTRLGLPRSVFVLFAAVFGSPLFFYGSFSPGYTHVVDALLFTVLLLLVLAYFRAERPSLWLPAGMGIVIGYSIAVRYYTGAEALGLGLAFLWYRRFRDITIAGLATIATFGLLAVIPYALGTSLNQGYGGKGEHITAENTILISFSNPFKMLFTNHRGLFVWTPVTLLGLIGLVLLFRRRPADRPFLVTACAMGVAIVGIYVAAPSWDGGFAFSQRYFTALFPLVAIGLAALYELRPRLIVALASIGVAWSIFLSFWVGLKFGFDEYRGGATEFPHRIIDGRISPGVIADNLYHGSRIAKLFPDPYPHG